MNFDHSGLRLSLGAYLLGGLDADEARAVEEHLAACPECRAEIEELEVLPAMLDVVPAARAEELIEAPLAATAEPVPGLLLSKVSARRRTLRLRWAGALAGAAAASLAGGLALGPVIAPALGREAPPTSAPSTTPTTTAPPAATYSLNSPEGAHVDLALVRKGWGTELDLVCRGMPDGGVYSVWVVAADGTQEKAASWSSTGYEGRAALTGATSYQLAAIRTVEIRDAAQNTIASVLLG
ncbi:anti-sigma factor family protein [Sinomonas sp. P47F7]|uniref:anti-sigma factor family protein n=1 Tax=Sinomonas sp. P47F7 TaxID=3410987 RepID=UPI003BF5936E